VEKMNKKLFIFMFLIMASPVFASDAPLKDEVVIEKEPVIEEVQVQKHSFVERVKDMFSRDEQLKPEMGEEVDAVKPETNTIEDIEKVQKKQEKELQKQQKEAEKAAKKAQKEAEKAAKEAQKTAEKQAKEAKKAVNEVVLVDENKVVEETQVVNEEVVKEEQTTLTNTAYEGAVETTKIMEVDECVKIALEKHPLIQSAMSNAEIYKSKIAQAWSNFFPTFSAGVSYSRNDMQVANFAFPTQEYDMFYAPTISGNMLLFDFGKTKAVADMAKISSYALPLLKKNGYFIAYKSKKALEEIENAKPILKKFKAELIDIIEYKLALDEVFERNLVCIKKL
jgi:chemotaxis protein histidine kinase CheA